MKYRHDQMQRTYNEIVAHLRGQGSKATSTTCNSYCMYRTEDGKKCAAGACIPDKEYLPGMEGAGLFSDSLAGDLVRECLARHNHDLTLVMALQRVHDKKIVTSWESWFKLLAEVFGLLYDKPADTAEFLIASVADTDDDDNDE